MSGGFKVFLFLFLLFTAFWAYRYSKQDWTAALGALSGARPPAVMRDPGLQPESSVVHELLEVAWLQPRPEPPPRAEPAPVEDDAAIALAPPEEDEGFEGGAGGSMEPASEAFDGSTEDFAAFQNEDGDGAAAPAEQPKGGAAPPDDLYTEHVVQKGDNLWILARRYLGGGATSVRRILAANPGVVDQPDRLRVGVKLKIPRQR